jgi:methylated-DNA-[protein]-cysteine S-methyltransferase
MKVGVATEGGRVVEIRFLPPSASIQEAKNPLAARAALQLGVWDAMCAIPRGSTRTYGELARQLGADARAIGQACGDNRLPLVIPCHRIVAADGLGGFAHASGGYLLEVKRWLLMHEAPAFELRP